MAKNIGGESLLINVISNF